MKKFTAFLVFLLCISIQVVTAQERTVTGIVTSSEDGEPIPGANVVVKGTTTGTISDMDGNFNIKVTAEQQILVFSFIGMKAKEVAITDNGVLNVSLDPASEMLVDVVVTALGIKRSKKALGYAVQEVNAKDMERVPVVDATEGLKGKVAGVSISSSSGAPGSSTSVIVRGVASISGGNQPLYVVDGVPINNDYAGSYAGDKSSSSVDFGNAASDINPSDIESISILKGAAATSLYGSRAGNGAIIITTKSGKKGTALKVNYSSSYSVEEVGRLPYYQNKFGQGWNGSYDSQENGSWGPVLDGVYRLTGNELNNSSRVKPFSFQENGLRDFYEYGYTAQNSIAVSGGTNEIGYYMSYANTNQDGVIPGDKDHLNRNTFTFKANGGTEKTRISFGATYTDKQVSAIATGQGDDAGIGKSVFEEILQNPVDAYIPLFRDYKSDFDNLDNYYTPYVQNPYFIINENSNDMDVSRINAYLNLNHKFTDGLSLMWRGGVDNQSSFLRRSGALTRITSGSPNSASAKDVAGAVFEEQRNRTQMNSDLILTYEKAFSLGKEKDLNVRLTGGNNINQQDNIRSTTDAKGLVVAGYYRPQNIFGAAAPDSYDSRKRTVGFYGTLDLEFNDFLFIQFAARNDWSSTLPAANNSFFYPGVNLGFIFSDFLPKNDLLTYGKLRTSYAYVGNDAKIHSLESYYSAALVKSAYGEVLFPLNGVAAYERSGRLGNSNLTPEISREYEIGADFRFLKNRIGLDISYYNKVTDKLIMEANISPSSGYTIQTTNLGQITNSGIEMILNVNPVKIGDFKWDITYVYTKSNTILDELSEELGVNEYVIYEAYETQFVAVPGKQLGQFRIPDYKRTADGNIIVGESGLPLEGGKVDYASSVPDYKMSLTNQFTYKGITLSCLLDYQKGGYMYSNTAARTFWSGNNEQSITNNRRPYIIPGSVIEGPVVDNVQTYIENTTPIHNNWEEYYASNTNKPIESSRIIEKTYVKLRDLSISYQLPSKLLKSTKVSNVSVSAYGRNLFLWTPASNSFVDPESSTYGNDLEGMFGEFGGAPSTRSYGVKLNLVF